MDSFVICSSVIYFQIIDLELPSGFLPSVCLCNAVHGAPADGDDTAGAAREGPFPVRGAADLAEAGGAGHQYAAPGDSTSAGHPVAAARLHQVSRFKVESR